MNSLEGSFCTGSTLIAMPFAWIEPTGNLDAVFSVITAPCTLAEALADGETNLVQAGETIASMFAMRMKASKGKSVEA